MAFIAQRFRAPDVSRLAIIAALVGGLAACSADMNRFAEGPFASSTRGNQPPSEVTGTVQGAPVGSVQSQPLPDSSANSLPPPPRVHRSSTGATPAPQAALSRPAQGGIHVVAPAETLSSIARLYGKSRAEVAQANNIKPNTSVRIGQRLTIPGVGQAGIKSATMQTVQKKPEPAAKPIVGATAAPKPAQLAAPNTKVASAAPTAPVATARLASPAADVATEASKDSQATVTGAVPTFRWPVRGRVIAGFGAKPNGQANDGINLAVPEGTSVKAAEDGVVAYSGNELKGYGNLVLVRHSNGFVTAYAHASELKVKRGETVKRGQIIALAGQTGTVTSPQLHFEIRKGSTPVDPSQYLSGN
jgi:murein DD-endopeptidase MepM/ murein hydrolase activator NlpD